MVMSRGGVIILEKDYSWADILVAVVNLRGDFLLEFLELITWQGARQELRAPLH